DAYSRPVFGSMAKSSKPCGCPHSGTIHLVRNFPLESNICIRLLIGSATYTLLVLGSTATEVWSSNCPSPLPLLPQTVTSFPSEPSLVMPLRPLPTTHTEPSGPVVIRRGP